MQKLTENFAQFIEILSQVKWFAPHMVLLYFLIVLLLWALVKVRLARHQRCKWISIEGERGDMFITINAIREFVKRILSDFEETSLEGIKLRQRGNSLIMNIEIAVLPDIDLVPLRDALQSRISEESLNRLGITQNLRVNIIVKSVAASEKKAGRGKSYRHQENELTNTSITDVDDDSNG